MTKILTNMRIGIRLSLAFAIVLMLSILLAAVGASRLQDVSSEVSNMEKYAHRQKLAEKWHARIVSNNALTQARLRVADPQQEAALTARMKAVSAEVSKILDELTSQVTSEEGKRLLGISAEKRRLYTDLRNEVFNLKADPAVERANVLDLADKKMLPAMVAYEESVAEMSHYQQRLLDNAIEQVHGAAASGTRILLVCTGIALAMGASLAWVLTLSITKPLLNAVGVARAVADGDLTVSVHADSRDEAGQMMAALKDMTARLNHLVGGMRASSDLIATASAEVAAGNSDLSVRTEQQASAIEETAASIEQLATTVQNNADNARHANDVAQSASEIASKGGAVVGEVVGTMGAINTSARKIVDIIGVIDGIAFQTNILALNAAVEAARAGEQGRGFAVVASEVRNLAQRSAAAAKEIKVLIDDSVREVEAGSKLVNEAGATMTSVVESVNRVTGIVSEIAVASKEQSEGIQQVNRAIREMDQTTQQNAALVEEATASTQALQEQARKMAQSVSVFKLERNSPDVAPHHPGADTHRRARKEQPALGYHG